ncbi:MAG: hypothetical protein E7627_03965 [Ruminococcaceae bacterium]|nr:hypothetical protein [Oscillospiraceae bacterium]
MKKTLLVLTCLIATIGILTLPVFAAEHGTFSLKEENVDVGATFEVLVSIIGGEDIENIGIIPSYDKNVFEYVTGQWLISGALEEPDVTKNGAALLAFRGKETVNGPVYSFILKVKDGAGSGSYTIDGTVSVGYIISTSSATVYVGRGDVIEHSYTEQVVSDIYKKSDATCTRPAEYYYSCKCCGGASATETFTYGEANGHRYSERVAEPEYLVSDGGCEEPAEYYFSCECGEKGTDTFMYGNPTGHRGGSATCTTPAICDKCGEEYGTARGHDFTREVKSNRYKASDATCTEKATYYLSCECGAAGSETFTDGYPIGHSFDREWKVDDDYHWRSCIRCNEKAEEERHVPGPAADENNAQVCLVCAYVMEAPLGHTHNYSADKWDSDSTHHWNTCSCEKIFNSEEHNWDSGTVIKEATTADYGLIEYICRVCYKSKTEAIDKLIPETERPVEYPTDKPTDDPAKDPTDKPADDPTKDPTDKPADDPAKDPTDKPADDPAKDPTDKPADDPAKDHTDNPADDPAKDPTDKPADDPAKDPTDKPTDDPAKGPTDKPTEPNDDSTSLPKWALALIIIIGVAVIGIVAILTVAKKKR